MDLLSAIADESYGFKIIEYPSSVGACVRGRLNKANCYVMATRCMDDAQPALIL